MSLSCRVSVSAREVMLVMATTAMQSTHVSWTTAAAMTWWVAEEAGMAMEVPLVPCHSCSQPWHPEYCRSWCCIILLACLWGYKDFLISALPREILWFLWVHNTKQSTRPCCVRYKLSGMWRQEEEYVCVCSFSPGVGGQCLIPRSV